VVRHADAASRIPGPAGEHSASLLRRGTLDVIVAGRGLLVHGGQRDPCAAGDLALFKKHDAHASYALIELIRTAEPEAFAERPIRQKAAGDQTNGRE
jgi:hypothetical protein